MRYVFPAVTFETTLAEQLSKIAEEHAETCNELLRAKDQGRDELQDMPTLLELVDVYHACETALRMFPKSLVAYAVDMVYEKNEARGYYD